MFSSDSDSEVTVLIVAMATASVVMATSGQAIARNPKEKGKGRKFVVMKFSHGNFYPEVLA